MFDVGVMLIAGIAAYILKTCGIPAAPLLLAFVLTPKLELYFSQAFQISNGDPAIFLKKPISLALLIFMVLFMIMPIAVKKIRKRKLSVRKDKDV